MPNYNFYYSIYERRTEQTDIVNALRECCDFHSRICKLQNADQNPLRAAGLRSRPDHTGQSTLLVLADKLEVYDLGSSAYVWFCAILPSALVDMTS